MVSSVKDVDGAGPGAVATVSAPAAVEAAATPEVAEHHAVPTPAAVPTHAPAAASESDMNWPSNSLAVRTS